MLKQSVHTGIKRSLISQRDQDRFHTKVERRGPDECWPWLDSLDGTNGYGRMSVGTRILGNQQLLGAHVLAQVLGNRDLLPGEHALHRCDNRGCCNPVHIFGGTNNENIADKVAKGRAKFRDNPRDSRSKLTCEQVAAIQVDPRRGVDIAAEYGISQQRVCDLRNGRV